MGGGKVIDLLRGTITDLDGISAGEAPCLMKDAQSGRWVNLPPARPRNNRSRNLNPLGEPGGYDDSAVVADIDGDGKPEVLFSNRAGGYHAVRQDGSGSPGWPKLLTPGGDCGMAVGDLYGDNTMEVVAPQPWWQDLRL